MSTSLSISEPSAAARSPASAESGSVIVTPGSAASDSTRGSDPYQAACAALRAPLYETSSSAAETASTTAELDDAAATPYTVTASSVPAKVTPSYARAR